MNEKAGVYPNARLAISELPENARKPGEDEPTFDLLKSEIEYPPFRHPLSKDLAFPNPGVENVQNIVTFPGPLDRCLCVTRRNSSGLPPLWPQLVYPKQWRDHRDKSRPAYFVMHRTTICAKGYQTNGMVAKLN